jgi:hypothetical protein
MGYGVGDGNSRRDRFVGSGGMRADVGSEGISGRFDVVEGPTIESHEAILKFLLGGEGQRVPGLGTGVQLEILQADSASVRCDRPHDPAIRRVLIVAKLRVFLFHSKNLKNSCYAL